MRASSLKPDTVASRSKPTRRPSTAATSRVLRSSGLRPSSWLRTSSPKLHGMGWRSSSSGSLWPAAASSSSRKKGLPPVRPWTSSATRNEGSRP